MTNRLAVATSPYLLQQADDPVDSAARGVSWLWPTPGVEEAVICLQTV